MWDPDNNPEPLDYPFVDIALHDAGHAWWKLTSDASSDAINDFTSINCSQWLNGTGWGYGPDDTAHVIHWVPYEKVGPGKVYAGDGSQTVHRIYACGFQGPGLIDALQYTDNLAQNPGTWDSSSHNCVHEVVNTGNAAGINLPADRFPEFFGLSLPPNDP